MTSEPSPLVQFPNITYQGKGNLRLNATGLAWKDKSGEKSVALVGSDLIGAQWACIGPKIYQLTLRAKRGVVYRFAGFKERSSSALHSALKEYFGIETEIVELSTKGVNYGDVEWEEKSLSYMLGDGRAFTMPLTTVTQCFSQKDVVTVGFKQEAKPRPNTDSLVEIRFIVKGGEADAPSSDAFRQQILTCAEISSSAGVALLSFTHVPMLTPREMVLSGRYDVECFDSNMRLHGKTFNYNVDYKNIRRIIYLPKPNDAQCFLVLTLDPPIRQGHTTYPHVVINFNKNQESEELELNASKEEYRDKYKPKGLKRKMAGKKYKVFYKVLSSLADKPILKAARTFQSYHNDKAVRCSQKAQDGFLFPLEKAFMFVHKPPTYIRYSEISVVEFARISAQGTSMSGRSFDLVVTTRSAAEYQFTGIQRNEFKPLYNFMTSKNINIKKIHGGSADTEEQKESKYAGYEDDDDEGDDDFAPVEMEEPDEEYSEGEVPDSISASEGSEEEKPRKRKREEEVEGAEAAKKERASSVEPASE